MENLDAHGIVGPVRPRETCLPETVRAACGNDSDLLAGLGKVLAEYGWEFHSYADREPPSDAIFCDAVPKIVDRLEQVDPASVHVYLRLMTGKPLLNGIVYNDSFRVIDLYEMVHPEKTPGKIVAFRTAAGEHLDLAIDYVRAIYKRSYDTCEVVRFNLHHDETKQYDPLDMVNALNEHREHFPPATIHRLLKVPHTHSHLTADLWRQILQFAKLDQHNYPGGVDALLDDLADLPMPGAQTWYEIVGELNGGSREKVQQFIEAGKRLIKQVGTLGHAWFIAWSEDMDIEAKAKDFLLVCEFCSDPNLVVINAGDDSEVLHQLFYACPNYSVTELIRICRASFIGDNFRTDHVLKFLAFFENSSTPLTAEERFEDAHVVISLAAIESNKHAFEKYYAYRCLNLMPSTARFAVAVELNETAALLDGSIPNPGPEVQAILSELAPLLEIIRKAERVCHDKLAPDKAISKHRRLVRQALTLVRKISSEHADPQWEQLQGYLCGQFELISTEHSFRKATRSLGTTDPLARRLALLQGNDVPRHIDDVPNMHSGLLSVPGNTNDVAIGMAGNFIKQWIDKRSALAGLLVIGGKIHVQKAIDAELFQSIKYQLGLHSTYFRLERSGKSIVLPAGQAIDLLILVKTLARFGLFDDCEPDLQLAIAGRWPQEDAAIVGSSIILASDRAIFYPHGAFSTTHNHLTGARIMAYDDGVRWPGLFDVKNAKGRTDILGRIAGLDVENYQIVGTLATHGTYAGRWKEVYGNYRDNYRKVLQEHGLWQLVTSSEWVFEGKNRAGDSLQKHEKMLRDLSEAWVSAQKQASLGVVGQVRGLIRGVVSRMHQDREAIIKAYPRDFARLQRPGFVYVQAA